MGSKHSKEGEKGAAAGAVVASNHSPLPQDPWPYPGPIKQYVFMQVNVQMQSKMGFNFSPGTPMITSNIDEYYPTIAQYYKDGYKIAAFFKIPGSGQRTGGLFSLQVQVPYQAVFIRNYLPDQEQQTTWQLKIEKSIIYMHRLPSGIIFGMQVGRNEVSADMAHLYNLIFQNAERGGRFVCMELTGQATSQGFGAAMQNISEGMGIDLFFNMPLHPNPVYYSYACVSHPIHLRYAFGFTPKVDLICDWAANLAQYLNQGYRLADIYLVNDASGILQQMSNDQRHNRRPPSVLNSVWIFEKEKRRLEDPTPVYQCTYIECYVKIKGGFTGTTTDFNVVQACQEMGNRGWKLVCFVDTPKIVSTGFGSATFAVMLFFQRKIAAPQGSGIPPPDGPPPGFVPLGGSNPPPYSFEPK